MKRYIFFSVLFVFFVALVAVVFYVFFATQTDKVPISKSIFDDNDTELAEPVAQNSKAWQDRFLSIKTKNYSPAVENFSMVFDVDTTALQPKSKFYQLIIDKNDIYSVFCLKQTLNSFDVKYSLTRSKDEAEIFLDTDNKLILEAIQKALTVYNINTQVKEIWL